MPTCVEDFEFVDPKHTITVEGSSSRGFKWKQYFIHDEYLLYTNKMCVPDSEDFRRQVLYECHDSPSAGHPRIQKTYELLRRQFF